MIKPLSSVFVALMLSSTAAASDLNLDSVKEYLTGKIASQVNATNALSAAADRYYALAVSKGFNYNHLAISPAARKELLAAQTAWSKASPIYEDIEGIVAGVESLTEFDNILDAGTSEGEDAVPFDLKLPNGKVLPKPGNLFGINEGALWGTIPEYISGKKSDLNSNGKLEWGEQLPDAGLLKAAANMLHSESLRLQQAANEWQPTPEDVFGALVGNVPTVGPVFFEDWKSSPFVLGKKSTRRDFVVISRLSDLRGNVASWRAMYNGLSPEVKAKNPALDKQINAGFEELSRFVDRLVNNEKKRRYTPEQAEQLQKEAQNRATVITGRITQAAHLLGVKLDD